MISNSQGFPGSHGPSSSASRAGLAAFPGASGSSPCFWGRDHVDPSQRDKNKTGKGWGRICVGRACLSPLDTTLALLGDASPLSGHTAKERKGKLPVLTSHQEPKQWKNGSAELQTCPGHRPWQGGQGRGGRDGNFPHSALPKVSSGNCCLSFQPAQGSGQDWGSLGVTQSLFVHRDPAEHRESRGRKASGGTR